MSEVTIYRIAHWDNFRCGLYQSDVSYLMDYDSVRHPMPKEDSGISETYLQHGESLFYGFSSKEQLRSWVYNDRWLKDLHYEYYALYHVRPTGPYALGNSQAVFHGDHYEIVRKESLLELLV